MKGWWESIKDGLGVEDKVKLENIAILKCLKLLEDLQKEENFYISIKRGEKRSDKREILLGILKQERTIIDGLNKVLADFKSENLQISVSLRKEFQE